MPRLLEGLLAKEFRVHGSGFGGLGSMELAESERGTCNWLFYGNILRKSP